MILERNSQNNHSFITKKTYSFQNGYIEEQTKKEILIFNSRTISSRTLLQKEEQKITSEL